MIPIKRQLTSKETVLSLLLLLLVAIILSVFIPQQFSTPAAEFTKWQQTHQTWLPAINTLGLHHIFTTIWFAGILFLFLVSLTIATYSQFIKACRQPLATANSAPGTGTTTTVFELSLPQITLSRLLHNRGYLRLGSLNGNGYRYGKHPWGHWGIFLLHLGILLSITGSLIFTVASQRGAVQLIAGETHMPSDPLLYEEHGLLAGKFQLPEALRLDHVIPEFWPQGGVKEVSSNVHFISPQGKTTQRTIATSSILTYHGLRIYQESRYGNAFFISLTDNAGSSHGLILDIASPSEPGKAGYGNFTFPGIPYTIKAKYYPGAKEQSTTAVVPRLVLRLVEQGRVINELSLTKGTNGTLGPYDAELVNIAQWATFTFMNTIGMTTIFLGFFVFSLGGFLYYFTIPREVHCQKTATGFRLSWKCSRFRAQYVAEYLALQKHLREMEQT